MRLYHHRTIVNWFLRKHQSEGRPMNIMKALKLCYIATGWYAERFDLPLMKGPFHAWKWGAVHHGIHEDYRHEHGDHIRAVLPCDDRPMDPQVEEHLAIIYDIYAAKSPFELSDFIKANNGAWRITWSTYGYFAPIGYKLLRNSFVEIRNEHAENQGRH